MGVLKLTYYQREEALEKSSLFVVGALEVNGVSQKNRVRTYRYGFQGQEKDDEWKGEGNSLAYENRIYDSRLGRWLSVDPVIKAPVAPYSAFANSPLSVIDPDGRDDYFINAETGKVEAIILNNEPHKYFMVQAKHTEIKLETAGSIIVTTQEVTPISVSSPLVGNAFISNDGLYSQVVSSSANVTDIIDATKSRLAAANRERLVAYLPVVAAGGFVAGLLIAEVVTVEMIVEEVVETVVEEVTGVPISLVNIKSLAKAGTDVLSPSNLKRIENAATRVDIPISVVGSRASGTAKAYSDWDYVIEGISSKNWSKIKNSLPGARSLDDNMPGNIDLFKGPLDVSKPHITIIP
jgi:RHS repeat-associated protein